MGVRVLSSMSCPNAWGSGPVGLVHRSSMELGKLETLFLKSTHKLSYALGPWAKQRLHRNLGQTCLHFLGDLMRKKGVTVFCCGRRTLEAKVLGIIIGVYSSKGGHFGKIWPHLSGLRTPGQTVIWMGTQPHPSANRLPKDPPRHTATSNLTQRQ